MTDILDPEVLFVAHSSLIPEHLSSRRQKLFGLRERQKMDEAWQLAHSPGAVPFPGAK